MKFKNLMLFVSCSMILGGNAFSAAPEKKIVTGPDDTVYGIAYNNGIPTRSLIAANNLKPPYTLKAGQVLIVPLPNQHIAGQGETVESIAEIYAINVDVLAHENNITTPSYIAPGTVLSIPARNTETLATALKVPEEINTSSLAPLPLVKSEAGPSSLDPLSAAKDTASNVALPDDLAQELAAEKGATAASAASTPAPLMNNLAEKKEKGAAAASKKKEENEKPSKEAMKEKPQKEEKISKKEAAKEEKVVSKKEEPKEEKKAAKNEDNTEAASKDVAFAWPVQGEILKKFAAGGKNDGINIKVAKGTPVKAAAAGTVMYAGNELKGFGNLLLLKHQDGWVTAYAHNSELLVKKGDNVKQGQEIAKSGTPEGDAEQPQLHFEIRKVKQPIDPLTKLES
ncbi:MAG: peptidoglycan DD-metalloendopeptidase family protein [Alphaproteobacteria bacterium]|nr:peptidoglycan DD-metalloendopeptidase family protein [Alphaproteobacteria bacterium]